MRDPKELIEECKKHLRDTKKYEHEYKKDIRKLITALERALIIADVVKASYCYAVNEHEGKCQQQCLGCSMKQRRLGQ
tara:strand:+ start:305 stop:538 length:234 start_codon:yes stop_codon:yes gene_type:complete